MRSLKFSLLALLWTAVAVPVAWTQSPTEAPVGFDDVTNGFTTQDEFNADRGTFDELEGKDEGLGPVYNAQGCGECHQNPTSGGISQITELRAGHLSGSTFIEHPGGSLINDRAINANFQERVLGGNEVRTFRTSLNTLGDGFVECIDSNTLVAIQNGQPGSMKGTFIQVPVLEAGGALRGGRFGWKNQHASLVSFSADAYLNEMGITNPLFPEENAPDGRTDLILACDGKPTEPNELEDDGTALQAFADFMSLLAPPPRGTINGPVQQGEALFGQIGCADCHVADLRTGTGSVFPKLNNVTFHPYSDFLLHDMGALDDRIAQGTAGSFEMRTASLWGVSARKTFLHDGRSTKLDDAILRHDGQGKAARDAFSKLGTADQQRVVKFLNSL